MQFTAASSTTSNHAPARLQFSPEQRAAAQAAAAAKREQFKANAHLYKTDYLEAPRWRAAASVLDLRMPNMLEPCTVSRMRTFLNRMGLSADAFCTHYGYSKLADFLEKNPTWTLFGFVGVAMEVKAGLDSCE